MDDPEPRFFCDAMFGGLARWLRAAGYDAAWQYGIRDDDLLRRARTEGRIVLTSDGPLMKDRAIIAGETRALFVPRGLGPIEALRFVLKALGLSLRGSRCMVCGGTLDRVPKDSIAGEVPARTFAAVESFYRCSGCRKLFWEGSHWRSIREKLAGIS